MLGQDRKHHPYPQKHELHSLNYFLIEDLLLWPMSQQEQDAYHPKKEVRLSIKIEDASTLDKDEFLESYGLDITTPIEVDVSWDLNVWDLKRVILRETKNLPFLLQFFHEKQETLKDLLKSYKIAAREMEINNRRGFSVVGKQTFSFFSSEEDTMDFSEE